MSVELPDIQKLVLIQRDNPSYIQDRIRLRMQEDSHVSPIGAFSGILMEYGKNGLSNLDRIIFSSTTAQRRTLREVVTRVNEYFAGETEGLIRFATNYNMVVLGAAIAALDTALVEGEVDPGQLAVQFNTHLSLQLPEWVPNTTTVTSFRVSGHIKEEQADLDEAERHKVILKDVWENAQEDPSLLGLLNDSSTPEIIRTFLSINMLSGVSKLATDTYAQLASEGLLPIYAERRQDHPLSPSRAIQDADAILAIPIANTEQAERNIESPLRDSDAIDFADRILRRPL